MRKFNRQFALRVFLVITGFNAMVMALDYVVPDRWLVIPWWTINFPSLPLFRLFEGYLPHKWWCTIALLGGVGLLSTLLWSVAAGYVFGRRRVV